MYTHDAQWRSASGTFQTASKVELDQISENEKRHQRIQVSTLSTGSTIWSDSWARSQNTGFLAKWYGYTAGNNSIKQGDNIPSRFGTQYWRNRQWHTHKLILTKPVHKRTKVNRPQSQKLKKGKKWKILMIWVRLQKADRQVPRSTKSIQTKLRRLRIDEKQQLIHKSTNILKMNQRTCTTRVNAITAAPLTRCWWFLTSTKVW